MKSIKRLKLFFLAFIIILTTSMLICTENSIVFQKKGVHNISNSDQKVKYTFMPTLVSIHPHTKINFKIIYSNL